MTITSDARRRRRATGFHWSQAALYVLLIGLALVYIFPFFIQIATMFKTEGNAATDPLSLIPSPFSTAALSRLFLNSDFPLWSMNSVIVAVFVTVGRALFDSMAGFALARLHYRGRNIVFAGLIAVMAVPGVALLIPKFLVITQLGLFNTYPGMILPFFADATGVFIMKNFFESIPVAIEESARVDGASTFRIYWSVVLPMATPALITIIILSFQGSWNELQQILASSSKPALTTLSRGVASLASGSLGSGTQYPLKLAAAMLMTVPVAIIFFVFQKRIMNMSSGAVKE